jgi:hypothetical protein
MSRPSVPNRTPAPASGEYVTNWSSLYGVAAVVALLVVAGFAALKWPDAGNVEPSPPLAESAAAVEFLPQLAVKRTPAFRRERQESDSSPMFDVRKCELLHGPAATTARSVFIAGSKALMQWARVRAMPAPELLAAASGPVPDPLPVPQQPIARSSAGQGTNLQLTDYLRTQVPTLDLDEVKGTTQSIVEYTKGANRSSDFDPQVQLFNSIASQRADLRGLPLLLGGDCTSTAEVAKQRQEVAAHLRGNFGVGRRPAALDEYLVRAQERHQGTFEEHLASLADKLVASYRKPENVPILEQLFQVESPKLRLLLVEVLERIDGPAASQTLARRAIFDLDEAVRAAARRGLIDRDSGEYEEVIARGLNYPFTPVVHEARRTRAELRAAKEAASKSGDQPSAGTASAPDASESPSPDEVAALLVDRAHVSDPYSYGQLWVVDELVKVNHLRNCVLCHATSHESTEPLRGQIPTPGQELPQIYYNSNKGNFVRADVVYLRQDFSVMLPVANAKPWPEVQRFDFFVRTRPATSQELAEFDARQWSPWQMIHLRARKELASWLNAATRGAQRVLAPVPRIAAADEAP